MYDFYKNKKSDKVYWVDKIDSVGQHLFSFDKQTVFNLFADYPHNLTTEQREIFDKENPYWADFFKDRGWYLHFFQKKCTKNTHIPPLFQ